YADQAKNAFQDLGYKSTALAGYENHYNAVLNRCFVKVSNIDSTNPKMIWTHWTVFDAFEGKVYGEYHWHTEEGKNYSEVRPFQCKVVPLKVKERGPSDGTFSN